MQLCFSTLSCPNWTLPQIVGAADAHGLGGVDFRGLGTEIDITRDPRFEGELDATLEFLNRYNLKVPCFNTSVVLVSPAPERWQMMLDECHRYAVLAARTGTSYLRIFGGAVPRGMSRAEAATMARRHLRQLIKICQPMCCQPLLETHDDWATSEETLELIEGFSPDEAAILWDLEHPWRRGESPSVTAASLGRYIRHVHIKDSQRVDGKNLPRLLGQGELPLDEQLTALRSINYQQWICLETEKRWHPQVAPEPEESLPQFVKFMREKWPCCSQ